MQFMCLPPTRGPPLEPLFAVTQVRSYFYADHVLCISDLDKATSLAAVPKDKPMHPTRFSILRHVYDDGVSALLPLAL